GVATATHATSPSGGRALWRALAEGQSPAGGGTARERKESRAWQRPRTPQAPSRVAAERRVLWRAPWRPTSKRVYSRDRKLRGDGDVHPPDGRPREAAGHPAPWRRARRRQASMRPVSGKRETAALFRPPATS